MRISIESILRISPQGLFSAHQRDLITPAANSRSAFRLFSMPILEMAAETEFWNQRIKENRLSLKTALWLAAAAFLTFLFTDLVSGRLALPEIVFRITIISVLASLAKLLNKIDLKKHQLNRVAKLGLGLSVLELLGIQFIESKPSVYAEIWVWLLPIYFFSYGQLILSLTEALIFGLVTLTFLPFGAYLNGAAPATLLPSIIILFMVNCFGFYSRRQLELQARDLFLERYKAEEAAQNKNQFLRQFSHNLRQPLQALSCYASILQTTYTDNSAEPMKIMVGKMGSAIDELNNAFNRILDITNLEAGQQVPVITSVDINYVLAVIEDRFAPLAAERGLILKVKQRRRPPFNIQSDPCILNQIIGNLVDNAIKYTRNGWVCVETVKISNRIKLHIKDSGVGIYQDQTKNIFKEFYRCPKQHSTSQPYGLGIGLAYVEKAVQCLPGHSLNVSSKPAKGSDFQLVLPLAEDEMHYDIDFAAGTNHTDVSGCFVIIIDDEVELLEALTEQILNWGCLVQKATNLQGLRKLLADNPRLPDLLITDYYLSNGETALDIITEIETDCGPTPTLVLSAHLITEENKMNWPTGTRCLRKPISAINLKNAIAETVWRC